jgi:hypothetical protein
MVNAGTLSLEPQDSRPSEQRKFSAKYRFRSRHVSLYDRASGIKTGRRNICTGLRSNHLSRIIKNIADAIGYVVDTRHKEPHVW